MTLNPHIKNHSKTLLIFFIYTQKNFEFQFFRKESHKIPLNDILLLFTIPSRKPILASEKNVSKKTYPIKKMKKKFFS